MNSVLTPIGKVKTNPNNPRILNDDKFKKLVNSIKSFPEMLKVRPIVVNNDMVVLGGNMRLKACKEAGLKEVHIIKVSDFTEAQQREFIIKDNVGFGEWDWELIANEWNAEEVKEWGLDAIGFDEGEDEFDEDFSLKDGDKEPFQQQTYTLADAQAIEIKNAIADIKKTDEYKFGETFGNENSNGNALYLIIMQWAEQKK